MKNIDSLKNTAEFQHVYKIRDSKADRNIVVYKSEGTGKVGIVCSKKVGNSVVRHRAVRLIREAYRLNKDHIKKDKDIVIVARDGIREQGFNEVSASFIFLLKRHGIYEEMKN